MEIKRNFIQSKMNTDMDERLLAEGEYPFALNLRVSNSDSSDSGSVENVKGNHPLTDLQLVNAKTIGGFTDDSNQLIYWFVTSDNKDAIYEYDFKSKTLSALLESTKPEGLLNFNSNKLITGVVKIINGDKDKDMIIWTDDLNPIRKINIKRSKEYAVDGFTEDQISLIKKPPRFAPTAVLTYSGSTTENQLEDKFLSFSYRYKYLDGEYSALSSYTNPKFEPSTFNLDFQTMENLGMANAYNAVNLELNTGSSEVAAIQLVVKNTNSEALYLIETFYKKEEGWGDNEVQSYTFSNSKLYTVLPEKELRRPYDNVPIRAKALTAINNRIIIGNYVEGYDLVDQYGEDVNLDYGLELNTFEVSGSKLSVEIVTTDNPKDSLTIQIGSGSLVSGASITFLIDIKSTDYSQGSLVKSYTYVLREDFNSIPELVNSTDFRNFIEVVLTNNFFASYTATPPEATPIDSQEGFKIKSSTPFSFTIQAPKISYDSSGEITEDFYSFTTSSEAAYRLVSVNTSLKSNRTYEVGIIYLDQYNRSTTVLTSKNNTLEVPQKYSTSSNKIKLNLNSKPPYFADRYKIVVKQNKESYKTIYSNLFYEDGLFRWVKLEGANKDKVSEGDTLIVKSDLGGPRENVIRTRVLEIKTLDKDFIDGEENTDGKEIIEESGLYMKIKPTGFDMNYSLDTARTFEGGSHLRYPTKTYTGPEFGETVDGVFVPYKLSAGSTVKINLGFSASGSISFRGEYDKTFRVNADYESVQAWFEAEVKDFGSFGDDYTRSQSSDSVDNYGYGYGFSEGGKSFYIWSHRNGTASRSISTNLSFNIVFSSGIIIFETEPKSIDSEIFYETEQTFEIIDGYHQGNVQSQSASENTAVVDLDSFNCYVQGNGAESYYYKDAFNSNFLNIDTRPTATDIERYKRVHRFSEITYSEAYNENSGLNGINEFNLSTLNFKEDIDKSYGPIQRLHPKDTDLVVFQSDLVSRVLYGKDALMNADGSSNVTATESVLGQQVSYVGEYGVSNNPESFAFNGNNIYFADAKRGCICRLGAQGITEISSAGMVNFFRQHFRGNINTKVLGAYDPMFDQYVLHLSDELID